MGFIVIIAGEVQCLRILVHQCGARVAGSHPFFCHWHEVGHQFLELTLTQPGSAEVLILFWIFLKVLSLLVIAADPTLHCCNHLSSWNQENDYFFGRI